MVALDEVLAGKRFEQQDRVLEDSFLSVVHERILETMSEALEEADFSPEEERAFRQELGSLPLQAINGVLSLPYELRHVRLSRLHERVAKKELSVPDVVQLLAKESEERGFTLGYHMSNADIMPKKNGSTESWTVDGREQDHRDSDLPMAYYSTDLQHLYGRKRARFMYIVRAETKGSTTHRPDNDGSWGRAPKLDIVEKLAYENVMQEARSRVAQERSQKAA